MVIYFANHACVGHVGLIPWPPRLHVQSVVTFFCQLGQDLGFKTALIVPVLALWVWFTDHLEFLPRLW